MKWACLKLSTNRSTTKTNSGKEVSRRWVSKYSASIPIKTTWRLTGPLGSVGQDREAVLWASELFVTFPVEVKVIPTQLSRLFPTCCSVVVEADEAMFHNLQLIVRYLVRSVLQETHEASLVNNTSERAALSLPARRCHRTPFKRRIF